MVIPTWNRAAHLSEAIWSALRQSVPPREVLVCDDGSNDESEGVVRSFNDSRVKWLPGNHSGTPAVPRNRGIAAIEGDWIAFLDSDDQWLPGKLETQLELAYNLGCKAACSNAYRVVPGKSNRDCLLAWKRSRISFKDLLKINCVVCSSALVHRSLGCLVGGFPEDEALKVTNDYAFWLRVATETDFAYVREPMVLYCDDPASSVRDNRQDESAQRKAVFDDFVRWSDLLGVAKHYRDRAERTRSHQTYCDFVRKVRHVLSCLKRQR